MSHKDPIILIATIGSSPAILTEAIHALHQQSHGKLSEIVIITTLHGKERLEQALFNFPEGGFYQWCRDYDIPPHTIRFENPWLIPMNPDGKALQDIRNREDDRLFADAVHQAVRHHCGRKGFRVFGLLSGGRKTMGAHLYSAMQIHARSEDRLFHILINEPFDSLPRFYYPTPEYYPIEDSSGVVHDASMAEVTLIDVPFLRLHPFLSQSALEIDQPYSEILQQIDHHLNSHARSPFHSLTIHLDCQQISLTGSFGNIRMNLPPRPLALLSMMAVKNLLQEKVASFKLEDLKQSEEAWTLHLLYYLITKKEASEDRWLIDPDYRRVVKTRSDLRTILFREFSSLEHAPELHLLIGQENRVANAEKSDHKLLLHPDRISIRYSRELQPIARYLESWVDEGKGSAPFPNRTPSLDNRTFQHLMEVTRLLQTPQDHEQS